MNETTLTVANYNPSNTVKLAMRMTFASQEARDFAIKAYGTVDAINQTIAHTVEYAARCQHNPRSLPQSH